MRDCDLSTTHSIMNPQVDRSKPEADQAAGEVALHKIGETDTHIVVRGARMLATLGAVRGRPEHLPGLRHPPAGRQLRAGVRGPDGHARPEADLPRLVRPQRSHFDYPLSSRFDEMDCVVIFDDVEVPKDRVFLDGDTVGYSEVISDTGWRGHIMHQAFTRAYVKLSFALGLGHLIADHDRRRAVRPRPGEARPDVEHGGADPLGASSRPRPARRSTSSASSIPTTGRSWRCAARCRSGCRAATSCCS